MQCTLGQRMYKNNNHVIIFKKNSKHLSYGKIKKFKNIGHMAKSTNFVYIDHEPNEKWVPIEGTKLY